MIISSHSPIVEISPWGSFRQLTRLCCNRECLASCGERTVAASVPIFRGISYIFGFLTGMIVVPVIWLMSRDGRGPDREAVALLARNQFDDEV
jgi:hypothetical protein